MFSDSRGELVKGLRGVIAIIIAIIFAVGFVAGAWIF